MLNDRYRSIPRPTSFGKNLRLLRKLSGLSQQALADQLQISRSKVASYEISAAEPSAALFLKFCDFLEVEPMQMLMADMTNAELDVTSEDSSAIESALADLLVETIAVENRMEEIRKALSDEQLQQPHHKMMLELISATIRENWQFLRDVVEVGDQRSNI